uniref:KASH domain-containing protein n=2 Tax=Bursaphelenchus xylophilus TaxID=6326 RepID=A0A1I7RRW7_BURXY
MSDQEENVFEQSMNSKYSDWTAVFDPNEVDSYRLHWDESVTFRSRQNSGERSSDWESDMDEARVHNQILDLFNQLFKELLEDIRRAEDDSDVGQEVVLNDLLERQVILQANGDRLTEMAAELNDYVQSKVSTIHIHMERLKLKQEPSTKFAFRDNSAASHLRKWLQNSELTLEKIKEDTFLLCNSQPDLQRLRATLQTLQLEIDTEGRHLLRAAKRHLTNRALEPTADGLKVQKVQRNLESLEQRWLKLYLGGVEQIERINNLAQRFESDDQNGSDLESVGSLEPARKRARPSTFSDTESFGDDEDTIPFASEEYRRIPTSHMTSTENIGSDLDNSTDKGSNKSEREDGWSSSKTQDVGYSSGENSLHEALNHIDSSPTKDWMSSQSLVSSYYKTVPLDDAGVTDNETPRLPVPGISINLPEDEMTSSMIVNFDSIHNSTIDTFDDYKEVMSMLDEKYNNVDPTRMGTNWKELKSNTKRLSAPSRPQIRHSFVSESGRMSCDASSEDSDVHMPQQMSESFSGWSSQALKASTPQTSSIRKRRYQRNSASKHSESLHNSFIACGKMDQSIYEFTTPEFMSQSLNLSTRALNNRRRFLKRRVHRSASENTNLLGDEKTSVQRRDSLNSNSSGITFQDSGDAHFEWDDYRDESVVSHDLEQSTNFSLDLSSPLLAPLMVDDDFQTELPLMDTAEQSGIATFLQQSINALKEARLTLESDKEGGKVKNVARIAAEHLKSIRSLMTGSVTLDPSGAEALNKLHTEWLDLVNSFDLPSNDALSQYEIDEVMDLFRTINHHYILFGSMCDGSDAKLLKESTLDDLRDTLRTRKKLFQQLRTNYMRMMTLVSRVPNLVPELEKVINNINVLNGSVSNLENFYELYCVKEKVVELDGGVKELDNCLGELSKRSVLNLNGSLERRVREIDEELSHCQDRMSSLEHVCNAIISRLNSSKFEKDDEELECCQKFIKDFEEMKRTISQVKTRLDRLFKLFPDCSSRSQQHDDSYSDSSLPESIAKPRKRRNLFEETKESCPETNEAPRMSWLTADRLLSPLRSSSSAQGVLVCIAMLAIGTLLLGLVVDEEIFSRNGHWSFRFGPQLHYVDGPPPV